MFGPDADLAVVIQRVTREAGVFTRDGHSDYGNAFVSFTENFPGVLSRAVRCWSSATAAPTTATRGRRPCAHGDRQPPRALAQPRAPASVGQRGLRGPALRDIITMHECRSAKQLAAVIDQLLPV